MAAALPVFPLARRRHDFRAIVVSQVIARAAGLGEALPVPSSTSSTSSEPSAGSDQSICTDDSKPWNQEKIASCSPYDCAYEDNWEHIWTQSQKVFCCQREGLGCFNPGCGEGGACPTTTTTTTLEFDCKEGEESWESNWTTEKKQYCCRMEEIACDPYNCFEGEMPDWPKPKADWCCDKLNLACTESSSPRSFDCWEDVMQWDTKWSKEKREYCCETHELGCMDSTTTSPNTTSEETVEYDCGWSEMPHGHWVWYPDTSNVIGRTNGLTGDNDYCQYVGEANSRDEAEELAWWFSGGPCKSLTWHSPELSIPGQTQFKYKLYCILADVPATTVEQNVWSAWRVTTTSTTMSDWGSEFYDLAPWRKRRLHESWHWKAEVQSWTPERRNYCCEKMGLACIPTTTSTSTVTGSWIYDCETGYEDWEAQWTAERASYCCNMLQRGCTSTSTTSTVTTTSTFTGTSTTTTTMTVTRSTTTITETTTSTMTVTTSTSTVTTTTSAAFYDCTAGAAAWKTGWSDEKKEWCCTHGGTGCPDEFNCALEYETWQSSWAQDKKEYCCQHAGRGCTSDFYDCYGTEVDEESHQDWVHSWPAQHQQWCCTRKHIGCIENTTIRALETIVKSSKSSPLGRPLAVWSRATSTAWSVAGLIALVSVAVVFVRDRRQKRRSRRQALLMSDDAEADTEALNPQAVSRRDRNQSYVALGPLTQGGTTP